MKATGIVRRIEEYGIIGKKSKKPHKHMDFYKFALLKQGYQKKVFERFLYIAKARGIPLAFKI